MFGLAGVNGAGAEDVCYAKVEQRKCQRRSRRRCRGGSRSKSRVIFGHAGVEQSRGRTIDYEI